MKATEMLLFVKIVFNPVRDINFNLSKINFTCIFLVLGKVFVYSLPNSLFYVDFKSIINF